MRRTDKIGICRVPSVVAADLSGHGAKRFLSGLWPLRSAATTAVHHPDKSELSYSYTENRLRMGVSSTPMGALLESIREKHSSQVASGSSESR